MIKSKQMLGVVRLVTSSVRHVKNAAVGSGVIRFNEIVVICRP